MKSNWQITVAYALTLFAAGVLIVASFFKAGDPELFAQQITAHQVTPAAWSPLLAYFFIAAELALAAALIAFVRPRIALGLNILMMLGFIGVTAWAWAHGNAEDCGCFGRLIERGPRDVIIEDTIVIISSLAALFLLKGFRTRPWQWTVFALLLVPVLVLVGFGPSLPIDGIVVGIKPGTDLSDMAIAGLRSPIDEGRVLIALVDPDREGGEEQAAALKQIAGEELATQVIAVCPGNMSRAQKWRLQHLPNFPVACASPRALRQYYRQLPVTFLLNDGMVEAVWWNRIPGLGEVAVILMTIERVSQILYRSVYLVVRRAPPLPTVDEFLDTRVKDVLADPAPADWPSFWRETLTSILEDQFRQEGCLVDGLAPEYFENRNRKMRSIRDRIADGIMPLPKSRTSL